MTVVELPVTVVSMSALGVDRIAPMTENPDFDRFFLDNFDDLVRSLTAITGDRERATDCVQEAFVRAFARWRRVHRLEKPVTWVRRVAINLSRDVHKADSRRRRREDRVHDEPGRTAELPCDVVARDLYVEELLAKLTPRQRTVAVLFYLEDLSLAEIGASLGLTTGAVKFHLSKARSSLSVLVDGEAVAHGR